MAFVPDSFEFVENCTNISYYENSIVERDVNTTREYSNLSDSSSSSSSSIDGSVNLALGKNSAKIEANKSSESQSRVTVSDDYIFIKRRELTIKPNFLSRVAIKASSVSGAFFNNCVASTQTVSVWWFLTHKNAAQFEFAKILSL